MELIENKIDKEQMPSNNEGERVRERHQERQTETQILTPVVSWSAAIKQAV